MAASEPTPEQIAEADALKAEGNTFFQEGKYPDALDLYTSAIELNATNAVYFANRAFTYIKLESYGAALSDANKAIELDASYVKGYYRRGSANFCLGKYKEALKDFKKVVQLKPRNATARNKLRECERAVRRIAFEEAIATDSGGQPQSAFENLSWESISVEESYTGPHLGDEVTVDFVKELIESQKNGTKLHRKYLLRLMAEAKEVFMNEPTLVEVDIPAGHRFTVCGDVHGQFYDFANIFELNGLPSETNPYLFNGDFVDRGSWGLEIITTMLALKVLLPTSFFMTRGNHESASMNAMYGFSQETNRFYGSQVMPLFTELFNTLPLCVVISGKVIVMHGGLFSQDGVTLDDIRQVDRFRQPPDDGIMCELLWSDPQPYPGRAPSKRGVGVSFGPDVVAEFFDTNGLEMLIRSHEVKQEGYEIIPVPGGNGERLLATVFSAPNYCDSCGNKGAFVHLTLDDATGALHHEFVSFECVPHPNIKPMAYAGQGLMSLFGL